MKKIGLGFILSFCLLSPLSAMLCAEIQTDIDDINADQDYLNSAYKDAQSINEYGEMADILHEMSQNFHSLAALKTESKNSGCSVSFVK